MSVLPLLLLVHLACGRPQGPEWTPRIEQERSPHPVLDQNLEKEIIYFVMIDRFFNGDSTNDTGGVPASHRFYDPETSSSDALKTYQGGDLAGVLKKLDYLKDLGITVLWLSPVIDNSDAAHHGWWAYHGYHPVDHFSVDEHFGTLEQVQQIVQEAHKRGIKVLLDMVLNHVGYDHPWVVQPENWIEKGYQHWFHPRSFTDESSKIQNWEDQSELENKELAWLPDLAQENPQVYSYLMDVSRYWIVNTGCDGFRVDAVRHIPEWFWKRYNHDIRTFAGKDFYLIGEVFSGDPQYISRYDDCGFDALFDFPFYFRVVEAIAQNDSIQTLQHLLNHRLQQDSVRTTRHVPFLDNHDVPRFSTYTGPEKLQKLASAFTFLMIQPGPPMIYYGTELGLEGVSPADSIDGKAPDYFDRRMMPWDRLEDPETTLVPRLKRLISERKRSSALRGSGWTDVQVQDHLYAVLRSSETDHYLVVLNTAATADSVRLDLSDYDLDASGSWLEVVSENTLEHRNHTIRIRIPGNTCLLYRLESSPPHSL
jgi:alpha-amylase